MSHAWRSLILVEDHPDLGPSLRRHLAAGKSEGVPREVRLAASVAEAKSVLAELTPEVVVLDVLLPDGTALDVVEHIAKTDLKPRPLYVAISGAATPAQAFRLAQGGVRAFVEKPFGGDTIDRTIAEAFETPPDVGPIVRSNVGHEGVRELEAKVRQMMVDEALAKSGGSRRAAARLLRISRQLLQHMLRK